MSAQANSVINPVGTGAFKFVNWDTDKREVILERNDDYWRVFYPKIERLVYAYMDQERALEGLSDGRLDIIRRLNPRKTTRFMRLGVGKVVKAWLPQLVLGAFNLLKPGTPLLDVKVRQAINLAVNRDHLIRYGAIGNGRLFGGYTVPGDPNGAELPPVPFDLEQSQRLLAEAGASRWPHSVNDGCDGGPTADREDHCRLFGPYRHLGEREAVSAKLSSSNSYICPSSKAAAHRRSTFCCSVSRQEPFFTLP